MVLINLTLITILWPGWHCGGVDPKRHGLKQHKENFNTLLFIRQDISKFKLQYRKTSLMPWTCRGSGWTQYGRLTSTWLGHALVSCGGISAAKRKGCWLNFEGHVPLHQKMNFWFLMKRNRVLPSGVTVPLASIIQSCQEAPTRTGGPHGEKH